DLIGPLAVLIGGPGMQSLFNDRSRRTQQDDEVELGIEFRHILRTPAHEQHIGVFGGQEVLNAILSPHPIPIPIHRRNFGIRGAFDLYPLGELITVSIYSLVSASGKIANERGLAGSRHSRQKNSLHDTIPS